MTVGGPRRSTLSDLAAELGKIAKTEGEKNPPGSLAGDMVGAVSD